jgi:glycine oxidase
VSAAAFDTRLDHPKLITKLDHASKTEEKLLKKDGATLAAPAVVVATGAWSGTTGDIPHSLPVRPVKGEVALAPPGIAVRQVTFGAGGYLVPRDNGVLVGATSEDAGFDAAPSEAGATALGEIVRSLVRDCPDPIRFTDQRAGLRPMTPDGYPILDRDPDAPAMIYACGYSRNGVLISPLAADCVGALVAGERPPIDLSAFSLARFGG